MPKSTNQLRIAFLVCDQPTEATARKHGGFDDILHRFLEPHLANTDPDLDLSVTGFDVVGKREYPTSEQLKETDAVIISGSFVDDACADTPWISRLAGFVVYLHDVHPRIRLIGICFGHQVIARAFGARVEENKLGWELGATKLKLSKEGSTIIGTPGKHEEELHIMQIHSDHVTKVPDGFKLLASSERTRVQMLAKYYEQDPSPEHRHAAQTPPAPYRDIHILTCQGHPEWDSEVIENFIDEFLEEGKLSEEEAEMGRKACKNVHDEEMLARALLRVLGVAKDETHDMADQLAERMEEHAP